MNPLMLGLMGIGGLGSFFGSKQRPAIDPAMLARMFGPQALAGDTQTLYNTLASSPMFQALMTSASNQGTAAGNATKANFARAGLSNSGVGALGSAVAGGFGQNLMLGAKSNLWGSALSAAQANMANRMSLWGQSQLAQQGTPTTLGRLGNALSGGASMGLQAMMSRVPAQMTNVRSGTNMASSVFDPTSMNWNRNPQSNLLSGMLQAGTN
jgi:hypothetical protein